MITDRNVFIVCAYPDSLVTIRKALIVELIRRGWKVTAIANGASEAVEKELKRVGAHYIPISIWRTGLNPFRDILSAASLLVLMMRYRPTVVIAFTIKPVIYGLVAAYLAGVPTRIAVIEGLGYAFSPGKEMRRVYVRLIATLMLRSAIPLASTLVVSNGDDEMFFRLGGYVRDFQDIVVFPSAGIDLEHFPPVPMRPLPVVFLMISRLLKDKGIYEYVEAARIVKRQVSEARFILVGPFDANPSGVAPEEVDDWVRRGLIEYKGVVAKVQPYLAECHVLVLPSYREGFPVAPMEAFSTGRPVILTDVPGCRDVVTPGRDGWLVPPKNSVALAVAMLEAISSPLAELGAAALATARARFSAVEISSKMADIVTLH